MEAQLLELGEKRLSLPELCARLDVDTAAVRKRMQEGRTVLEAIYETRDRQLRDRTKIDGLSLQEARKHANLSQKQLAERMNQQGHFGFTSHTIHSLEHGKQMANEEELAVLAQILDR